MTSLGPVPPAGAVPPPTPSAAAAPAAEDAAGGFADALARGLEQVSSLEHSADALARSVAAGGPAQVHDLMIATSKATLAVELLVQMRNRAVEAYQEIMRLPV